MEMLIIVLHYTMDAIQRVNVIKGIIIQFIFFQDPN